MAESVGGVQTWLDFLYIFKCGVEKVTASKIEVQEYEMGQHFVDLSKEFKSSIEACGIESYSLVAEEKSTDKIENNALVLSKDGKLEFTGGNKKNVTFSVMAESAGKVQAWINFLYIFVPEVKPNQAPLMFGLPAVLKVLIELKPAESTFEWESRDASDNEKDPIKFAFSGDVMDKQWFRVKQSSEEGQSRFGIKIDKTMVKEEEAGSFKLVIKVSDGISEEEPNEYTMSVAIEFEEEPEEEPEPEVVEEETAVVEEAEVVEEEVAEEVEEAAEPE